MTGSEPSTHMPLSPNGDPIKIGVIGLGYVGLPLARLFSTRYPTIGFDINPVRVEALKAGHDDRLEVSDELLQEAFEKNGMTCTSNIHDLKGCNFYIVAVPTPVDNANNPDLSPLLSASELLGKVISKGDIAVYESTVYPGVTEEECMPAIERSSGLHYNVDFFGGYSPERINPGDRVHTVEKIRKVTSGSTPEIAELVDTIYNSVLENGTYKAKSIKVAEAAKVIENAQRDISIAFFNELSMIFNAMGIDTTEVIDAASSKWNFTRLEPGLVGGHCISVDPYYLIYKAKQLGIESSLMTSAREINEGMGKFVVDQVKRIMQAKGNSLEKSKILILGFTFKENCPDIRNTKVETICNALREYTDDVTIADPWADHYMTSQVYGINLTDASPTDLKGKFDAVIIAVAHKEFKRIDVKGLLKDPTHGVIYDVKGFLPEGIADGKL